LRSGLGRFSICSRETFVPISDVRDSTPATAVARISTLGYLGSFVGPVLIGSLASLSSLPVALGLPALMALATAFGARAVRRTG